MGVLGTIIAEKQHTSKCYRPLHAVLSARLSYLALHVITYETLNLLQDVQQVVSYYRKK